MFSKSAKYNFMLSLALLLINFSVTYSQVYNTVDMKKRYLVPDENVADKKTVIMFNDRQIEFEPQKSGSFYWFGPEIPVTGLTGYYDYQTNGECKHYINRFSPTVLHAIYMTSSDSIEISTWRRTRYSFSDDDGETWNDFGTVPSIRSGFCSLTSILTGASSGAAVIANHYQPGSYLAGFVNYDISPGGGSFTGVQVPFNIVWPGVSNLSNGNIMVVGSTYVGGAASDTLGVAVFNTTTHTFSNFSKIRTSATGHENMRWTYAGGPNGNAICVICPISDVGGNFSANRIYISHSTNNGVSWGEPTVLYNPSIINGDTVVPFFGLDAIYDAAGNYYVAFNSLSPEGSFASAKLWVIKNGGAPSLVAQHTGTNSIPEAAETVLHADAGICTIDHPSLSISSNGACIYVAYSVQFQNDTLNGFNKCHIFCSFASTNTMSFYIPIQVTNSGPGSYDERYASIAQTTPDLGGQMNNTVFLVYQKDPQPGSSAFNDGARMSRASLIFRKLYGFTCLPLPGIHEIGGEVPKTFSLHQNYPNPFNPSTLIKFDLPLESMTKITVYDVNGRVVEILVNENLLAGRYEVDFDASNLASGVYFCKIQAEEFTSVKKMVLMK